METVLEGASELSARLSESELPEIRWLPGAAASKCCCSVGGVHGVPAPSGSDSAHSLAVCAPSAVCAVRAK